MSISSTNNSTIKHGSGTYKNQPGRIENYVPGHSSISEKEAKEVSVKHFLYNLCLGVHITLYHGLYTERSKKSDANAVHKSAVMASIIYDHSLPVYCFCFYFQRV